VWRRWCPTATEATVTSGHFLAEENPQETVAALLAFLSAVAAA
jgi:haloacetate dehalogenase